MKWSPLRGFDVFVASITVRSLFGFVVLAATETDLLLLIGVLVIALKYELERLVGASLFIVRTVAEWLILWSSASAIIVSLTLLECDLVRLVLSYNCLLASLEFLAIFDVSLRFSSCRFFLNFVLNLFSYFFLIFRDLEGCIFFFFDMLFRRSLFNDRFLFFVSGDLLLILLYLDINYFLLFLLFDLFLLYLMYPFLW